MKCGEFETRLNDLLDARQPLAGDKQLAAHAAECETCRADLSAYGALAGEIAARPRPLPSADLVSRVMADLATPQVERPADNRTPWVAFALAAALLIAAFPVWSWWSERAEEGGTAVAVLPVEQPAGLADASSPIEQASDEQASDLPIGELVRQVGDRYFDLAQETQANYAELALLLPGVRAPREQEPAPSGAVATADARGSRGWVNDMTEGLKPVTNSTVGAFSFLLEALPTEIPAEKL
ncbi:MAG: hypothetical protein KF708_01830 [Pirellulales bacterium]|nr:hypothetical protein [Pirellulales bacterium]